MKDSRQLAEKRTEAERMQDVRLLLDHLARSQETTVKLILDCLYDVGAVNLINQQVPMQPFNRVGKSVASISKPVFRIIAYRWFCKNAPQLIVNWLHKKISFGVKPITLENLDAREVDIVPAAPLVSQISATQEVKRLRAQVRILAGMLIGAIALFGGTTLWLIYGSQPETVRMQEDERAATLELCISPDSPACSP